MSNRFPCSDEQINKNAMEEILKTVEDLNKILINYNGPIVEINFNDLPKEDLKKLAEQENIILNEPDKYLNYYFIVWKVGKLKVHLRTVELKIKKIIYE